MCGTHRLMVIHQCAKYGKPMSNQNIVLGLTRKHVKILMNLTLRSKFKVVNRSWMHATHHFMLIHPCAKYGKPMSNQFPSRTRICTDRRTDRRTDKVIPIYSRELRSRGYKKVIGWTQICTDRRTDRRTELFLYTPLNFVHGGLIKETFFKERVGNLQITRKIRTF